MNIIVPHMSPEEYHAHSAISKSGLAEFQRSPAHYQYWRNHEKPDSDALRMGSAFHTLLLEPDTFAARVHVWAGMPRNTKSGKDAYAEAISKAKGRLLLRQDEYEELLNMARAISEHVSARVILSGKGQVEATMFWADHIGVDCRARPDWIRSDGLLVDLKTARDARPHRFEKDAYEHLYHWQAAMYCDGYEIITGQRPAGFAFVTVEKTAPYGVSTFVADEAFIDLGRAQYREALARFAECRQKNEWPKYEDALLPLSLPSWVEKRLNFGEPLHV